MIYLIAGGTCDDQAKVFKMIKYFSARHYFSWGEYLTSSMNSDYSMNSVNLAMHPKYKHYDYNDLDYSKFNCSKFENETFYYDKGFYRSHESKIMEVYDEVNTPEYLSRVFKMTSINGLYSKSLCIMGVMNGFIFDEILENETTVMKINLTRADRKSCVGMIDHGIDKDLFDFSLMIDREDRLTFEDLKCKYLRFF